MISIVSDLHIDQWSSKFKIKFPCGPVVDRSLNMDNFSNTSSDYLIVAGDVSDDLEKSAQYIEKLSRYYKKILVVDGNHEHIEVYPKLYTHRQMAKVLQRNDRIHFLPGNPYIIGNTAFLGYNGWWDYNGGDSRSLLKAKSYFNGWIPLTDDETIDFIVNVHSRSLEERILLESDIKAANKEPGVSQIVIVTHTVPSSAYCSEPFATMGCERNIGLLKQAKKPVKYWVYGHTHDAPDVARIPEHRTSVVRNPRGRPEDRGDTEYGVMELEL